MSNTILLGEPKPGTCELCAKYMAQPGQEWRGTCALTFPRWFTNQYPIALAQTTRYDDACGFHEPRINVVNKPS